MESFCDTLERDDTVRRSWFKMSDDPGSERVGEGDESSWSQDNVAPPFASPNLYLDDPVLVDTVGRGPAAWSHAALVALGRDLADPSLRQCAREADRQPPVLERYDERGRRVDRILFAPAWHTLLASCFRAGLPARAWFETHTGARTARAASYLLHARVDAATLCPTTMTYAAVPLLRRERDLWAGIGPALRGELYDPSDRPLAQKTGGLVGMGLTEIQGGSDLRRVTTRAVRTGSEDDPVFRLHGRKWFLSVPQSDAHLVLARDEADRLGCYYVPRILPDGERNAVRLERLKDKLGNRANATAEAIFEGAWGRRIGEPARGLALLMEMANTTRLDNVLGSTGLLREGLALAAHHARHRRAFDARLVDQPIMRSVLADLALETAAATAFSLHLAALTEDDTPEVAVARRILIPAGKFWICKRAITHLGECVEVLGGNGYMEDGPLARLYREAPVNSIWEGSGNVMVLDVLRALRTSPEGAREWWAALEREATDERLLLAAVRSLTPLATAALEDPGRARHLVARLVLVVQAFELRHVLGGRLYGPFVETRLGSESWGAVPGLVSDRFDTRAVIEAVVPDVLSRP